MPLTSFVSSIIIGISSTCRDVPGSAPKRLFKAAFHEAVLVSWEGCARYHRVGTQPTLGRPRGRFPARRTLGFTCLVTAASTATLAARSIGLREFAGTRLRRARFRSAEFNPTPQKLVQSNSFDVQHLVVKMDLDGPIKIQLPESNLSVFRKLTERPGTGLPINLRLRHRAPFGAVVKIRDASFERHWAFKDATRMRGAQPPIWEISRTPLSQSPPMLVTGVVRCAGFRFVPGSNYHKMQARLGSKAHQRRSHVQVRRRSVRLCSPPLHISENCPQSRNHRYHVCRLPGLRQGVSLRLAGDEDRYCGKEQTARSGLSFRHQNNQCLQTVRWYEHGRGNSRIGADLPALRPPQARGDADRGLPVLL